MSAAARSLAATAAAAEGDEGEGGGTDGDDQSLSGEALSDDSETPGLTGISSLAPGAGAASAGAVAACTGRRSPATDQKSRVSRARSRGIFAQGTGDGAKKTIRSIMADLLSTPDGMPDGSGPLKVGSGEQEDHARVREETSGEVLLFVRITSEGPGGFPILAEGERPRSCAERTPGSSVEGVGRRSVEPGKRQGAGSCDLVRMEGASGEGFGENDYRPADRALLRDPAVAPDWKAGRQTEFAGANSWSGRSLASLP